ncbi:MAG TPA: SAF domain-containing protein [Acetobacteraceae bacterium]|nr:SAF domain-containing protein [Acetobacteraceae bacterium]
MHFTRLFAPAMTKPVTAALLGCGEFGRSLIAQARRLQGLRIAAAFDLDPARVSAALAGMGVAPGEILVTDRIEEALSVPGLDMVVEATGHAEAAAGHALAAIERGIGVAMVSKEAECVIGPVLAARARAAGVAYTLVDGDQPALLIGLVSWARLLGLPIVAAGKSSEYDYVLDPATGRTRWTSEEVASPGLPGLMGLGGDVSATLARRAEALAGLPQRTGPDYCEMALVANATGLPPARPDFHAPLARTPELPEIYGPRASGGVLERTGVLDVFNCLRRTDEASFAGGVFVVVELADERTGELFHGKGIPVSRDRRRALVYNPSHLLGVEAPVSVMAAGRLGHSILDEGYRPVVDLVARAARDLPVGHVLTIEGNRHVVPGLDALLLPAAAARDEAPLPYYMAVGRRLRRPVRAGEMLRCADLEAPGDNILWQLRAEQDAMFMS